MKYNYSKYISFVKELIYLSNKCKIPHKHLYTGNPVNFQKITCIIFFIIHIYSIISSYKNPVANKVFSNVTIRCVLNVNMCINVTNLVKHSHSVFMYFNIVNKCN